MQFKMYVNLDNSAFEDSMELARIVAGVMLQLRGISNTIPHNFDIPLKDSNGNPVGYARIEPSDCGLVN